MISKKFLGVALSVAMMSPHIPAQHLMVSPQIDINPVKHGAKVINSTSRNRVSQKKRRQRARQK